jgi:hypothetical protein
MVEIIGEPSCCHFVSNGMVHADAKIAALALCLTSERACSEDPACECGGGTAPDTVNCPTGFNAAVGNLPYPPLATTTLQDLRSK